MKSVAICRLIPYNRRKRDKVRGITALAVSDDFSLPKIVNCAALFAYGCNVLAPVDI